MRSRPDVDVRMPPVVHPGDEIQIELNIESHADTPVDFIALVFEGVEIASGHIDGNQHRRTRRVVHREWRLREKGTLTAGPHQHRVQLTVPSDAPASYLGVRIEVRYEVRLHVSIPWWPDLQETYELLVEPHPARRPPPKPQTATSVRTANAFIELSLTDTAFAPGDEITGAFAVGNAIKVAELGVEISLVAIEHARTDSEVRRAEQFRYMLPGVLQPLRGGGEVAFHFRVPKEAVASFASPWCKLEWSVHAALTGPWGTTAATDVPVHIDRYNLPHEATRARAEVGAARWRRTWAELGARFGLTLRDKGFTLDGSRGDVQIEVALDQSDDETAMVATLRYPSLELGLRAAPQFLVVLPHALELLLPGHKVECRDLAQGLAFFDPKLLGALRAFKTMRVDDARTFVRQPGPAHIPSGITVFLDMTVALAETLVEAISHIPPPAALHGALPQWRAFAAATGAHLAVGGMKLTAAAVEGGVFDIATLFGPKGELAGTRIDFPIDPPLTLRAAPDGSESFASASGADELAVALRASVRELAVRPHALTVDLADPVLDPADLRPRLAEMLLLVRRLRGERSPGPYR